MSIVTKVRLFARARDLAGTAVVSVTLADGATVGDLRNRLAVDYQALRGLLERSALAVNGEFAADDWPLASGAEIALLPPVSGGGT
jgi:molybdopterin converting factor subunit 1